MSDPQTLPGAAARLGQSLISALPPAFVMLVLINVVFIGIVVWFLDDQIRARDLMARQLFERCMDISLHAPTPKNF